MPGVNDRPSRPTIPFDSQRLARQKEDEDLESIDDVEFALAEQPASHPHVVAQPARTASGTTPPDSIRRIAAGTDAPSEIRSRTATVHDPLTTSVLAEVARRAQSIDTEPPRGDDSFATEAPTSPGLPSDAGKRPDRSR